MSKYKQELAAHLSEFQLKFEEELSSEIPRLGRENRLRDACQYALLNGGKRFRPYLVHLVASAVNAKAPVMRAALAVEYLHTASLIADDLPCMDNDDFRRSKPSLHKAFDESTALLASYALISAGYGGLAENARLIESLQLPYASSASKICTLALENVTYNTGLLGATGGQFLDIYPPDLTFETVVDVIRKKTVSLFEISFVLGWLYAGGDFNQLGKVKKAADSFGLAFQIADDIGDQEQDLINGRKINVVNVLGLEKALELFHVEIAAYQKEIEALGIATFQLQGLSEALVKSSETQDKI